MEQIDTIKDDIISGILCVCLERGINFKELAEMCGVSKGYISRILRKKKPVTIDNLLSILQALNITFCLDIKH